MQRYLTTLVVLGITSGAFASADFIRGDANCDGQLTVTDACVIWEWWAFGEDQPCDCQDAMNVNGVGSGHGIDLSDIIYLTNYLFRSGPEPAPPFPSCGTVEGANCNEATGGC